VDLVSSPPGRKGAFNSRFGFRHALGLAAVLRILFALVGYLHAGGDVHVFYQWDTKTYLAPARELVAHLRFFGDEGPELQRTPGYPLLLAAGLLVGRLEFVIVLQLLLALFTMFMVYRIAQLLLDDEPTAILAATLYAVEPLSIFYVSQLLSEILFMSLVVVWLYFLLKYMKRQSSLDLVIAGLALAASIYVRPVGYYLPVIIASGLAWLAMIGGPQMRRRRIAQLALFVVVAMTPVILWQVRNQLETGFNGFSAISSVSMYQYLGASILAGEQHKPLQEIKNQLGDDAGPVSYLDRHPEQRTWTPAQRYRYMMSTGEGIVFAHPFTYARIHLAGLAMVLFSSGVNPILEFFRIYPGAGRVQLADWGMAAEARFMLANPTVFLSNAILLPIEAMYLLGAAAALASRRLMRKPAVIAIILACAYYLIIAGGPAGLSRFRVPIMPIMCVLAAYGLRRICGYGDALRSSS
jgi:4-amino-4-deoxy-L-arabinose transferase-like glycosyltransferase